MKSSTKKILKWTGIVFGVLLLAVVALGAYVYSLLPKPAGEIPALQSELFTKPDTPLPVSGKFIYKTATELAAMIRKGEATSTEVVQEYLHFIKNNNYKYNALVWLFEEEALQAAARADSLFRQGILLGPLHGVPMTVKEQFFVKGKYSMLNAKMIGGFRAPEDQKMVAQLRKAGAIIIGTTNVPLMLMDYQTQGEIYPPASNPYDTTRTPGGSTGGGGAALAAGFTPLEVGGDLGGSIRVPAAFCGLYGLKTTEKAIDIWDAGYPGFKFDMKYSALAVGGPLARTPEDVELLWSVLKDTPNQFMQNVTYHYDTTKMLNQYRIAWMDRLKFGKEELPVSSSILTKLHALVDSLKAHGAASERSMPDTFEEQFKTFFSLMLCMNTQGQPWLMWQLIVQDMKKTDDGSIDLRDVYDLGISLDEKKYGELLERRKNLIDQWESFFEKHDFFICPVMLSPAFKKCPMDTPQTIDGRAVAYWNTGAFCMMFNGTGHPSLVIPLGLDKDGLPVGVQVVGKYFSEPALIHFAKLLRREGVTPGFVQPEG
ncbi:MAG: hypothetical protein EPO28_14170 [Saprospiraceae bacterium]|nr:MAG: hypothetical protein EPO28_14170 [Saprospiraceae bacterium]